MQYSIEQYLALGIITLIFVAALTPVMRVIAIRVGAFDSPNIPRKVHKEPVPYLGGIDEFSLFLIPRCSIPVSLSRLLR